MANLITYTEDFTHADWTAFDSLGVTPDTHAAPAGAGMSAGLADTLADANAGAAASLFSTYRAHASDSSNWIASLYIRKDTNQTRFPVFGLHFENGTTIFAQVSCNTETGATAHTAGANSSGSVNVDATWWRFWVRIANNNTGNNASRMFIYPADSNTLGGSQITSITGSIVCWGANQVNADAIGTYEPDPAYPTIALTGTALGTITESDIRAGGTTIICTLTGSTYIPS